jgi:hypothetical protein
MLAARKRPQEPRRDGDVGEVPPAPPKPVPATAPHRSDTSLLKANAAAKQHQAPDSEKEREAKEEQAMMQSFLRKQALRSAQENAAGVVYKEPMKTGWKAPSWCATHAEWRRLTRAATSHLSCTATLQQTHLHPGSPAGTRV